MKHFEQIKTLLNEAAISLEADFHSLTWGQVDVLLYCADLAKYRVSKTSNGSRARGFFEAAQRAEAKEHKEASK